MARLTGRCPAGAEEAALEPLAPPEVFGDKAVSMRRDALRALRRLRDAARLEAPTLFADPSTLSVFSAYRSPASDAQRCRLEGNCQGRSRAECSPHRTGLAADLQLGELPGRLADDAAPPNRLFQSRSPAYLWLLANAGRFGFVNYAYEPWHWEWAPGAF
jgi:LAS superfamily LD-carboxypeptidase LdcB